MEDRLEIKLGSDGPAYSLPNPADPMAFLEQYRKPLERHVSPYVDGRGKQKIAFGGKQTGIRKDAPRSVHRAANALYVLDRTKAAIKANDAKAAAWEALRFQRMIIEVEALMVSGKGRAELQAKQKKRKRNNKERAKKHIPEELYELYEQIMEKKPNRGKIPIAKEAARKYRERMELKGITVELPGPETIVRNWKKRKEEQESDNGCI